MNTTIATLIREVENRTTSSCLGRNGIDPDFWSMLSEHCPRCGGGEGACLVETMRVMAEHGTVTG